MTIGPSIVADPFAYPRTKLPSLSFRVDRLVRNLRRVAEYDMQYFAAVEPQRRLAAHAHFAIRGTIPRAIVRQVVAATYRQIWWTATGHPVYSELNPPEWADHLDDDGTVTGGGFFDPGHRGRAHHLR